MYSSGMALQPPKGPCRTRLVSTARGVALQAASQKFFFLVSVALHCGTALGTLLSILGAASERVDSTGMHKSQ